MLLPERPLISIQSPSSNSRELTVVLFIISYIRIHGKDVKKQLD